MNLIDQNNESLLRGLSGNSIDLGKSSGATIAFNGPVQISNTVAIAAPLLVSGGLGLYGSSALAQFTTVGLTSMTTGTGASVRVDSQFTGGIGSVAYTLDDLVAALKKVGIIGS